MNFDEAIRCHTDWKLKLNSYINKRDQSLKAAEVGADGKCLLGQWLSGDGRQYAALPEFTNLQAEHSRFHKAAADVVRKADDGKDVSGEVMLGGESDFAKASFGVVSALMAMKSKVQ